MIKKKKNKKGNYSNQKNQEPPVKIKEEKIPAEQLFPQTLQMVPVKEFDRPLVKLEEAVAAWGQYQALINALIKSNDIVVINNIKKAKKSGINKIARFFGYSCEIIRTYKEEVIGPQGGKGFIWRVWAKAIAPTGRFRVSGGACSSIERRFAHLEHDVLTTAETRAKKRAIEELAGMGELELIEEEEKEEKEEKEEMTTPSSKKEIKQEIPSEVEKEKIEEYEFAGKKYVRRISADGKTIEEGINPDRWIPMFEVSTRRMFAGKGYSANWKKAPTGKQLEVIKSALQKLEIDPETVIFVLDNRADKKPRLKKISELDYGDAWDLCETIIKWGKEAFMNLIKMEKKEIPEEVK